MEDASSHPFDEVGQPHYNCAIQTCFPLTFEIQSTINKLQVRPALPTDTLKWTRNWIGDE